MTKSNTILLSSGREILLMGLGTWRMGERAELLSRVGESVGFGPAVTARQVWAK